MTNTQENNRKAGKLLQTRTMADLLEMWKMTEFSNKPEIPTVRGWLMDEFELRNPKGFNAWLDGDCKDSELAAYMA